jgi:hypothetical protein
MPPFTDADPVVVSFHTGGDYYDRAAQQLRSDCVGLGIDHDIRKLDAGPTPYWAAACRRKIGFYLDMLQEHRRPILWLDVDTRIGHWPGPLRGCRADMAAFMRGLRYLRDFDPIRMPRFFSPFALYFNDSAPALAFVRQMVELEAAEVGPATDDYFLEEAWRRHDLQLSMLILPPTLIGHDWPLAEDQMFQVGISGNVARFKSQVKQHEEGRLGPAHRAALFMDTAVRLCRQGRDLQATMLLELAVEASPQDQEIGRRAGALRLRLSGLKPSAAGGDGRRPGLRGPVGAFRRWLGARRK